MNVSVQGLWKSMFEVDMTSQRTFEKAANSQCQVPMMQQQGSFRYAKFPADKMKMIELPYKGDDVSMVLLLPMAGGNLQEIESRLTHEKVVSWLSKLNTVEVELSLPRFQIEDTFSLTNMLKQMGLVDLFNAEKASLPGITPATISRHSLHYTHHPVLPSPILQIPSHSPSQLQLPDFRLPTFTPLQSFSPICSLPFPCIPILCSV